jgi:dTDP-glucose 4,6-dehydratase
MTNILITGGLGFIGSCLIKYLLGKLSQTSHVRVFNVDYLGYGSHLGNIDEGISNNDNYLLVKADINEIRNIESVYDVDIIVNVAAETHVDRSINDPSDFVKSNYKGTFALLEYARHSNIDRFIQVSTDEVYGEARDNYSFKETDSLNPSNPYSSTKAAADLLVNSYYRTYGISTVITRCTNNFGPHQFPEKLIPKTIIRILLDLPILLYGSGIQIRDWLYVLDHVRAIDTLMAEGQSGHIYNISASNPLSNIELVKKLSTIVKERCGKVATIKFVEDRPGHDYRYSLDSTKIRSEFGWNPETNFDDGLRKTVDWYLRNKNWWENLIHPFITENQPWRAKD